jgi:CheY-like chemotaxis protein
MPGSSADAEDRLKAREEFLKLMSHEMRTPLNGVLGMLGLLSRTRLDGAQKAYLTAARESGEHLLSLVNDILDFAKIEAGKLELDASPVDLELLLQGAAELLSPKAHEKGIEIAWAIAPEVPHVLADEGRLRQVLFNLAGNAVKFTETGGVLIRVDAVRAPKGKGQPGKTRLRFTVRDSGPGVPAEARARIFEEFGHADPAHAIRYGGAGLGLAVVRRLAAAMEGDVGVGDAEGGGAVFWFEAAFTPIAGTVRQPSGIDQPVVIASPSAEVREAAALQIDGCCGQARGVATLDEALAETPDDAVVLVDHAFAAKGQLLPKPRGRKALILLTPDERGLIEKYRLTGYGGYLIKPLRRSSLAARVAALTGRESEPASRSEDERIGPGICPGARVLLVEDNPVNALLAQALLKREGCAVERAGTGEEALTALSRTGFDIVLMDVRMPGMGGLAATRALRARGDETPVIALTATAFEDDRRAALESGMNDFLSKPFEAATLRALLARWTKRDHRVKLAS